MRRLIRSTLTEAQAAGTACAALHVSICPCIIIVIVFSHGRTLSLDHFVTAAVPASMVPQARSSSSSHYCHSHSRRSHQSQMSYTTVTRSALHLMNYPTIQSSLSYFLVNRTRSPRVLAHSGWPSFIGSLVHWFTRTLVHSAGKIRSCASVDHLVQGSIASCHTQTTHALTSASDRAGAISRLLFCGHLIVQ